MEALSALHLLRPLSLLALPVWLLLVYWLWRSQRRENGWSALCDPALLGYLLGDSQQQQRRSVVFPAVLAFAGGLLILALAGPVWQSLPQPVYRAQSAMVIVLDLSRSMTAGDLKPSRLQRAKQKVQDILQARTEGQTGLVVFAGSAFDVVPLTTDNKAILALLPSLDTTMMPAQGSRASAGLEHAAAMLKRGTIRHGSILMLADGVDDAATDAAKQLATAGHRLSIFGVGTAEGAPIPLPNGGFLKDAHGNIIIPRLREAQLAALSTIGGGIYQRMRVDTLDVQSLPNLQPTYVQREIKSRMQSDQWREEGPWLVLLVLPLLALIFRRGVLLLLLLVPLAMPDPVSAMEWRNLWQTPDQQGQVLLRKGDAKAAAERFRSPAWKGSALYKSNQYTEAAKILATVNTADGQFNRGNALAKAGQLQEAVAAYDQALKQAPSHADAAFNRTLVEKLLQQQKAKQKNQEQNKQGNNKDQQSDKSNQQSPGQASKGQQSSDQRSGSQQKNAGAQSQQRPRQDAQANQRSQSAQQQSKAADAATEKGKQSQQHNSQPAKPAKADKNASARAQSANAAQKPGATANGEKKPPEARDEAMNAKKLEEENAHAQWLRRIPDDPGGLLRRKFQYQYQQQSNHSVEGQTW